MEQASACIAIKKSIQMPQRFVSPTFDFNFMKCTYLVFILLAFTACDQSRPKEESLANAKKQAAEKVSKYPDHVGDIAFDDALDDPEFKTCQGQIPQYYALGPKYRVDNDVLLSHFGSVNPSPGQETVYHTIRFVVNCKGEIGQLREETMNNDYQAATLHQSMKEELRSKLLAFDQWPQGRDYYQYLTFKIEAGKIKEVLP